MKAAYQIEVLLLLPVDSSQLNDVEKHLKQSLILIVAAGRAQSHNWCSIFTTRVGVRVMRGRLPGATTFGLFGSSNEDCNR